MAEGLTTKDTGVQNTRVPRNEAISNEIEGAETSFSPEDISGRDNAQTPDTGVQNNRVPCEEEISNEIEGTETSLSLADISWRDNAQTPDTGGRVQCEEAKANEIEAQLLKKKEKEERLRKNLKLYFFNPVRLTSDGLSFHIGYIALFLFQIFKCGLISAMLVNFGTKRGEFNEMVNRGHTTLRNLFIKNWDASWEAPAYPPANGEFAVYNENDIEERINFAVAQYYNIEDLAIGYFTRDQNGSIVLSLKYVDFGEITGQDEIDIKDETVVIEKGLTVSENGFYSYNVSRELEFYNISKPFKRLLSLSLDFTLKSVRIIDDTKQALCLNIKGSVQFKDKDDNGQAIEDLVTKTSTINCKNIDILSISSNFKWVVPDTYLPVLVMSALSMIITLGLFGYGIYLCRDTTQEAVEIGKIDNVTILLGVGCLTAWFSLLRYFKFNNKFHLLFSTLTHASGNMIAYLICIAVLFTGFCLCGYTVLQPYNIKFKTPASTIETLLALMNGDEIFATLALLDTAKTGNRGISIFSQIYIITFVALYTIIVLNLVIAIINTAYETTREYHDKKDVQNVGNLERALQDLFNNAKSSDVTRAIVALIKTNTDISTYEQALKKELLNHFTIENNDIVARIPLTLKSFYKQHSNDTKKCCLLQSYIFAKRSTSEDTTFEP